MSIYQFLIAVRQKDGELLTNDAGETTRSVHPASVALGCCCLPPSIVLDSHLMGLFYRTIRIVENGIKPAYVFDGKPPDLKAGVVRGHDFESLPDPYVHSMYSFRNGMKNEKRRKRREKRQRRQVREDDVTSMMLEHCLYGDYQEPPRTWSDLLGDR